MLELEVLTPRLVWSYYYRGCQQWGGSHHRSDPPLRPASADTLDDSHLTRSGQTVLQYFSLAQGSTFSSGY